MNPSKKISVLYQKFSYVEGNQHIASEYAIRKIQVVIKKFQISRVLEVGLGVGSISAILLNLNERLEYFGTENNQFCLKSLQENLGQKYYRLRIFDNIISIPPDQKFELIIIDGRDEQIEKVHEILTENGIIVIEGDRNEQLEVIKKMYPKHKAVHSISLVRNKRFSPFPTGSWQGGVKIVFVYPSINQYLWWAKEKTLTFLKYKIPGRHLGRKKLKL